MLKQAVRETGWDDFTREDFRAAYAFLSRGDLADLPLGRHEVNERVFALVQEYDTQPSKEIKWEAHNRYYDVQFVVSGRERFWVTPRASLREAAPYDEAADIVFFQESGEGADEVLLLPGDMVIVGAREAHKPRCADQTPAFVRKIVVKVPVKGQ